MKVCAKCGGTDFTEKGKCRPCCKAYRAKYYIKNKAEIDAKNLAYAKANPDATKRRIANHYAKNKEKLLAANAKWRIENKELVAASKVKWAQENREKCKESVQRYQRANPDVVKRNQQNRSARKRNAGGQISHGLEVKLFKLQRGKCACCGLPLGDNYHLDHIMPIALGGQNIDSNMQLLRASCNHQKSAKHPIAFMQSRGFLL